MSQVKHFLEARNNMSQSDPYNTILCTFPADKCWPLPSTYD